MNFEYGFLLGIILASIGWVLLNYLRQSKKPAPKPRSCVTPPHTKHGVGVLAGKHPLDRMPTEQDVKNLTAHDS